MKIIRPFMAYMRERQAPVVMYLHLLILLLVISQIIVSNFMGFTRTGEITGTGLEFYGTWMHIITGLTIVVLALVFMFVVFRLRGFSYYFPCVFGNLSQLKSDLGQLMKAELPEPKAHGLAAAIQGLGLGALCLVLISGLIWFISWNYHLSWSHDVKEVHEALTGLVQAYIIGHGGMGLLHIFLNSRTRNKSQGASDQVEDES